MEPEVHDVPAGAGVKNLSKAEGVMADPNIELVQEEPHFDAASTLLGGNAPAGDLEKVAAVPPSVPAAAVDDGKPKKPGRRRLEGERTASGRLKRPSRTYGRAEARTLGAGPAAAGESPVPSLAAPVQGPPPPTDRPLPSAEEVAYVAVFARIGFIGATSLLVRYFGADYKPTDDELSMVPEASARLYLHLNPAGLENSPWIMFFAALGMYGARASGMTDKVMAQLGGVKPIEGTDGAPR